MNECVNCNDKFDSDEPSYDGYKLCDVCRDEMKSTLPPVYWNQYKLNDF